MPSKKKSDNVINYLVCVNKEEYSKVAVHFACNMAKKNNGTITLLHVIEPADYQTFGAVADKMKEEQRNETENLFQELAGDVFNKTGIRPILLIKEGLIEDEIIKLVDKDNNFHMLVVGSAPASLAKSKIIPPLVAQSGNKLRIPIVIIPGTMEQKQIDLL